MRKTLDLMAPMIEFCKKYPVDDVLKAVEVVHYIRETMLRINMCNEVEATVYSLPISRHGFSYQNMAEPFTFCFIPLDSKDLKPSLYEPTATFRMRFTEEQNCEKALKVVEDMWNHHLSLLLDFASGKSVYLNDFRCNRRLNEICNILMRKIYTVFPKESDGYNLMWPPGSYQSFIETALPLMRNHLYLEKTGVGKALIFFNLSSIRNSVEIKFSMLWISLEILANSFVDTNPKDFLLTSRIWNKLIEKFKEIENFLKISQDIQQRLHSALGWARQGFTIDKIKYLLQEYGLGRYTSKLNDLNELRNDIFHGRDLEKKYGPKYKKLFENEFKLRRLTEKIILKILHFYETDHLFPAIKEDNLLAV